MNRKIGLLFFWIVLTALAGLGIWVFDKNDCGILEAVMGALIALFIEKVWRASEDISDTTNWKTSLRQLLRGGAIKKETLVRISFAYLYRIKVGSEYLLVKNARGTGKYQPIGGVYKLTGDERIELNNRYHVIDDDKVPIDESSRDDYRLQMPSRYLKKFMNRFDSRKASRERIDDVSREFKEEIGNVLGWSEIRYRYCGRHITDLKFGDHFHCYELLLADIIELLPTETQRVDLENIHRQESDKYRFATAEEIKRLGIIPGTDKMVECIADHSVKILQENEQYLAQEPGVGTVFEVSF